MFLFFLAILLFSPKPGLESWTRFQLVGSFLNSLTNSFLIHARDSLSLAFSTVSKTSDRAAPFGSENGICLGGPERTRSKDGTPKFWKKVKLGVVFLGKTRTCHYNLTQFDSFLNCLLRGYAVTIRTYVHTILPANEERRKKNNTSIQYE